MRLILIYIYLSIISKISQGNQYQKYWDNLLFSPSSLWDSVCFLYLQHASLWGSPMWLVAAVLTCSYKGSLSLVGLTSVHTHPSPPLEMEEEFILWQDTPLSDSGFTPLLVIQAFSSIIPCSSLCCSTYFFPSGSYHSHPWKENFLLSHIDLVSPALYKKPMSKGWRKLHNTNTNQNKIEEAINITGLQSKPIARDKSLLNNKWSIYYGQLGTLHLNIHADPLEKGMAPTPVFFPGEFHGQRSLASYSP